MLSLLNLLSLPPGGGVVPDIFRELQKPTRFAWGGGLWQNFCRLLQKQTLNSFPRAQNAARVQPETDICENTTKK